MLGVTKEAVAEDKGGDKQRCQQTARQGPGGTEILAEARHRNVMLQPVPQRDRHDEHGEKHVLQPGQCTGDAALPDLIGRDFVKQFLNQPQGAEPPADGTSQDDAEEQDDAHNIPAGPVTAGGQGILDRAQGTGAYSAGAGIAVEARDTGILGLALVDLTVDEAFQMRVVQQRAVKLDESSR